MADTATVAAPPVASVLPTPAANPARTPATPPREVRALDLAPGTAPVKNRSSARDDMLKRIEKAAGPETTPIRPVTPEPTNTDEDGEPLPVADPKTEDEPAAEDVPCGKTPEIDAKTGKPKKANPWKIADEYKARAATLEAEVQRLKTSIVPEQERTAMTTRLERAEGRAKELEDHIRFVDYEKSAEFKDKFQTPYEKAWHNATKELSEISITDTQTGATRPPTSDDILKLVNLPLGDARAQAREMFGEFVDDAMRHRKAIRDLFEQRNTALEDAKKNSGERFKQVTEQTTAAQKRLSGEVAQLWKQSNEAILADPENGQYFKPIAVKEGQQPTPDEKEWNEYLQKGFDQVDKAWNTNAADPKLNPEQRAEAVRLHTAIRNRSAAFGPLKRKLKRVESKLAKAEADLAAYSATKPSAGGSVPGSKPTGPVPARQAFQSKLEKAQGR